MLSTARRLSASVSAVLMGSIATIGSHFSHIGNRTEAGLGYRPAPSRKYRPAKRKGYRTIKAEGVYGANLRRHFDKNRLTRSQRNRFYAGKAI